MRWITVSYFLFSFRIIFAQNIAINSSGSAGDASAILDLNTGNGGNKGFLPPQVALTATNAAGPVTSPATGLLVYNTATAGTTPNEVIPGYYYWNGTAWVNMITTSKVTCSIPYLMQTSTTSGRYYVPGYNVIRDNFNDYGGGTPGPGTVTAQAAYMADNNYVVMSNGTFSKVNGWVNVTGGGGKVVTIVAYKYTPSNGSSGPIAGTQLGSTVTVTCTTAGSNYSYEITGSNALTKGDFIMVWYSLNGTGYSLYASGTIECFSIPQ
jgi:hypothetical protein